MTQNQRCAALILFYLLALGFLSLNPWLSPDSSMAFGGIAWDKIDHAAAYGMLSLLIMSCYRYHKRQLIMSFRVLMVCSLLGVLFEYCQLWFTVSRQFSYHDAVANIFGAGLGVSLFWCYALMMPSQTK